MLLGNRLFAPQFAVARHHFLGALIPENREVYHMLRMWNMNPRKMNEDERGRVQERRALFTFPPRYIRA